jgi:KipI family sensor histidine kinase inhibitor
MIQQHSTPAPEVLPLGQDGVLVRFAKQASFEATAACLAFQRVVEDANLPGLTDVVPSLISVLLQFDPARTDRAAVTAATSALLDGRDWLHDPLPAPKRCWHIPVAFGGQFGPQLTDFASVSGLSEDTIVAEAQETELRVLAIGFAPGQPYLGYLPEGWQVPRQSSLTPRVPAGAIATAIRQMVLFTSASTTGWRQIAETGFRPFLQERSESFLLRQGDAMRLHQVSHDAYRDLLKDNAEGLGGARCEVLS